MKVMQLLLLNSNWKVILNHLHCFVLLYEQPKEGNYMLLKLANLQLGTNLIQRKQLMYFFHLKPRMIFQLLCKPVQSMM